MSDVVFRKADEVEIAEAPKIEAKNDPIQEITDNVPTPYTETKDFLEDYFGLGTQWKDQDMMFFDDINMIDQYIKLQIKNGEVANDQEAVKKMLGKFEMLNNLTDETRSVVRLEVLANYAEFLLKNENLKSTLRRLNAN
jgi:hypothetical protein